MEQAEYVDYAMFHLDGPEALPHLDLLLDIPNLNGIQWQPGFANYPMTRWISLLKGIQAEASAPSLRPDPMRLKRSWRSGRRRA